MLGLYRASTWARGRLGIVIPWNSDAAAAANARWRGVVGEGLGIGWGRRVSEREGARSGDRGRGGSGIGRWGQADSGVGGLCLARWWAALGAGGPVGLASSGLFPLFLN